MTVKQTLAICLPQWLVPDYPTRAAKENGDKPEDYSLTRCPDCSEAVWLGPRVKAIIQDGVRLTCAICAIHKHGVTSSDAKKMINLKALEGEVGN